MKDIILYGAGSDMVRILPMLKKEEYNPLCIADGNKEKVGQYIWGGYTYCATGIYFRL